MPVLGPEFQTFERVENARLRMIEAKERAAAKLAHNLLETEEVPTSKQRFAQRLGRLITGREPEPVRRESVLAFYEPNDDASEEGKLSMAAFFSSVGGGVLFTREVLEGDGPPEERLGYMQPRAVITEKGWYGYPVVALNEEGDPVFPSTMTLEDRDTFVTQVAETLSIISSQSYIQGSLEQRAGIFV
jgi:hypothetical protein